MKEAGEKRDWRVKGMPRAPSTQPDWLVTLLRILGLGWVRPSSRVGVGVGR